MSQQVVVLGGGMVGGVMACELARYDDLQVIVVDRDSKKLHELEGSARVVGQVADLSDISLVQNVVRSADLVINAVPGFLGYQTCELVIAAGKDIVDIAFFPEDPFALEELAAEKGVRAILDCGVAPGMSNLLVGYADTQFDTTDTVLIYVGGLPRVRTWPFEYKAVFSPIDVIEEYTRPARYIENGKEVVRDALSDPELLDFKDVGTLEAFNTDGLRSLARTISAPNQKEKTLRYPGHIEKMAMLREMGMFSHTPISLAGQDVRPIELTAALLFPMWQLQEDEEDLTVMRVIVRGERSGKKVEYRYDLNDSYDRDNKITSMARTTGYTATVVARMVLDGEIVTKGLLFPEHLGKDASIYKKIVNTLENRHAITYQLTERELIDTPL